MRCVKFLFIFSCIVYLSGCSAQSSKEYSSEAQEKNVPSDKQEVTREIAGIRIGMPILVETVS